MSGRLHDEMLRNSKKSAANRALFWHLVVGGFCLLTLACCRP
jgi:hypothetical protein